MIKYYVRTFHRLPPSKWVLDHLHDLRKILDEMILAKPPHQRFMFEDLVDCISVVSIDTEKTPNWRLIFPEFRHWDWIDLEDCGK